LDFRIIDIRFNSAFFKIALEDAKPSYELLMVSKIENRGELEVLKSF
jgi:hypothetical protein